MSKVTAIKLAKTIKKSLNIALGKEFRPYISWSRRINSVKTNKRICAMTFDDGPTKIPPVNSDTPLTQILVDTLERFCAKGTFDIIGTTKGNYPDTEGKIGTPSWSGVAYDHYPSYNMDEFAGADACPELVSRILKGGHEITNHTWSHVLYGSKNIIYSERCHFRSFGEAKDDLLLLDSFLKDNYGYNISLSRPPHYVDNISHGLTAYDLYALVGYQYMGASFDGAGWLPCSTYDEEVAKMVTPVKSALEKNPDALCGQIIFQKDGYNMALRTPVVDGLPAQLELLKKYNYEIVTVSSLIDSCPFSDVGETDPDFKLFSSLVKTNAIAYTDNTLKPDALMTKGELAVLLAPKEETVNRRIDLLLKGEKTIDGVPIRHPYSTAWLWGVKHGYISSSSFSPDKKLCFSDFNLLDKFFDLSLLSGSVLTRRAVFRAYLKNN